MNLLRFGFLCAAGVAALGLRAAPVWHTWLANPADGNWLGAANWNTGAWTAGADLGAVLGASRVDDVSLNGDVALTGLTVQDQDWTISAGGGALTLNGPATIGAGRTLTVGAPIGQTATGTTGAERFAVRGAGTLVVNGAADRTNVFCRIAAHDDGALVFNGGAHEITATSSSPDYRQVPLFLEKNGHVRVEGGARVTVRNANSFMNVAGGEIVVTNGVFDAWNVNEVLNGFADQNTAGGTVSRIVLQDGGTFRARQVRLGKAVKTAGYYTPEYGTIHLEKGGTLETKRFYMDGNGTTLMGAIDFEGGLLKFITDASGQDLGLAGYAGNWKNVELRVHEGGAYIQTSGVNVYPAFRIPFIPADPAKPDGGLHFQGGDFYYLDMDSSFTGGVHIHGGTVVPRRDRSLGAVPETPRTDIYLEGGMLHAESLTLHKNRDIRLPEGKTANIGVQNNSTFRFPGVIDGPGANGSGGTLNVVANWLGNFDIGPADDRTNRIGRLRVYGHLRHREGTTLITLNAPSKTYDESPLHIKGDGASFKDNRGVLSVAGGLVKVPNSVWLTISDFGQLVVTNGTFDCTATAELLNGLSGAGRIHVGDTGVLAANQVRITQSTKLVGGEPACQVVVATGGVMRLNKFWIDAGGFRWGSVFLDGGTLVARRNEVNFLGEDDKNGYWHAGIFVRARAGGARFDTAGFSVTVKNAVLSGAAVDGGVTKLGAGTLTLNSTNSYNGATCVERGTLAFAKANGFPGGHLDFTAASLTTRTGTTPYVTAPALAFRPDSKVRVRGGQTLDARTFGGKRILATVTTPFEALPELALLDDDGNELPSAAWKLSLSADGRTLLFGANRGTMIVVR